MQNERVFYMDKAVDLFSSLREEKVSERIDNAHLGAMGAVNVQVWTSVLGGTLQYETSNGGCTLRVIHTNPVLEENIQDGWVACSERMPEDTQMVLAFSHGEIVAAYWNYVMCPIEYKKYRAFTYLSGSLLKGVTHWMPLPAAPQQEVKL